ncbi:MAG TPA: hypothetical protein VJ600_08335 [Holophagaceae bacterium]|nr:hypothetical protein [Holophagaceae bacterium]
MKSTLVLFLASPMLLAQGAGLQGGGTITLGQEPYRFEPASLMASKADAKHMRALQIRGRLVPKDPSKALDLELVAMGTHYIYRLSLVRQERGIEKERWAATLKTQIWVEAPEKPKAGDRATFKVSGPLTGSVDGLGRQTTWSGEIWAAFSVEQVP